MLRSNTSQLMVIDIQDRLAPAIHNIDTVVDNGVILLKAAKELEIPVFATEQYPKGLGHLVSSLHSYIKPEQVFEKIYFSADREDDLRQALRQDSSRNQIVVFGTEAHICVQQTALDLRDAGFDVAVVADASSSRAPVNAERAYSRMMQSGIQIVTTEMVLFEWMERAATGSFRKLSKLIK